MMESGLEDGAHRQKVWGRCVHTSRLHMEGGPYYTACCGTVRLVHAGAACFADFLAIGEPRGAAAAGICEGGGVFSLAEMGLVGRPPRCPRSREGARPPRSTFESQLTMGKGAKFVLQA